MINLKRACILVTGLFIALAQAGIQNTSLLKGQVYTVDRAHSLFDFTVQLVGFNRVRGAFKNYDANLYFVENDLTQSSINIVVEVKSVDTGVEERDEHLRSADFFASDSFAVMTFQSERIEKTKEGFAAAGPLTIRGRTRTARIPFRVAAPKAQDPFGNERVSFAGQFTLKRSDFGIVGPRFWNQAISEEVEITFELAGRVWNYFNLGWGPKSKKSIGEFLFRTADSLSIETARREALKLWAQYRNDQDYNFDLFEFQKAAGRLMQRNKIIAAVGVLELAVELRKDAEAADLADIYARLGEAYARDGKREQAVQNVQLALQLDIHNTYALEVSRHLN